MQNIKLHLQQNATNGKLTMPKVRRTIRSPIVGKEGD